MTSRKTKKAVKRVAALAVVAVGVALVYLMQHSDHTGRIIILVSLCAAILALLALFLRPNAPTKDAERLFSNEQRREGFRRAGGRCEWIRFWFFRCPNEANHGDHWYPHSKGGATSMRNFVALCASCNRAKSATTPSRWRTSRLSSRRRSYFPPNEEVRPGEWNNKCRRSFQEQTYIDMQRRQR